MLRGSRRIDHHHPNHAGVVPSTTATSTATPSIQQVFFPNNNDINSNNTNNHRRLQQQNQPTKIHFLSYGSEERGSPFPNKEKIHRTDTTNNNMEACTINTTSSTPTTTNRTINHAQQSTTVAGVPRFAFSELTLGTVIGTGGFSTVTEIKFVDLDELYDNDDDDDDNHQNNHHSDPISTPMRRRQRRRQFADSVRQGNTKYVLKMLRTDLPMDEHAKGIADLAIEASFLQVLSHPHIISLQGVSHSDPNGPRFFIVLERLRTTLDRKFNEWRRIINESAGYWIPCYGYCCPKVTVLHANWIERFTVAHSIASALEYLHQKRIIYRDLKPDNIGFDGTGRVQMFDFGLAKRLDDVAKTEGDDENYRLTGNTGSLRYMSPEVARNLPYNLSADSYSFGILFWQICALQTPFAGFTSASHFRMVVQQNQRPHPDKTWPWSWTECMIRSWSAIPKERPSMTDIVRALEEMILDMEAMAEEGIVPCRTSEIRAKKKRKKIHRGNQILDLDTRKNNNNNIGVAMIDDNEIV